MAIKAKSGAGESTSTTDRGWTEIPLGKQNDNTEDDTTDVNNLDEPTEELLEVDDGNGDTEEVLEDAAPEEQEQDEAVEQEEAPKPADAKPKEGRAEKRIKQLVDKLKTKDRLYEERMALIEAEYQRKLEEAQARLIERDEVLASTYEENSETAIKAAKDRLRQAKLSGDADEEIDAQIELTEAMARKEQASRFKNSLPKEKKEATKYEPTQLIAQRKTQAWVAKNEALINRAKQDPTLAATFQAIDQALVAEDISPHEDEYFTEFNKRLNKKFERANISLRAKNPYEDVEEEEDDTDYSGLLEDEETAPAAAAPKPVAKKPLNVMGGNAPKQAPAKRNVIRISPEDQQLAIRLGIDPALYLKQKAMGASPKGYQSIYIPQNKKK